MPDKTKVHTVYKLADGKRVPSVTTVLGILNKPALLDWAWQCGCDGLDYRAVRDDAAGVGSLAHYLIMCHLRGEQPDTSEYSAQDIKRAENCLIKYYDWEKEHKVEPVLIEEALVSEQYRFGGTIDCLAKFNDELWLVDYKTGKAIYPEMFYQLAAYRQLLEEAGHHIANARILRIGRDETSDFEERIITDLSRQWDIFLNCLEIYTLQKEIRKGGKDDLSEV
jgi:hypothetical protein